jgi:energy-converting hydrogenase Eha subunit E
MSETRTFVLIAIFGMVVTAVVYMGLYFLGANDALMALGVIFSMGVTAWPMLRAIIRFERDEPRRR